MLVFWAPHNAAADAYRARIFVVIISKIMSKNVSLLQERHASIARLALISCLFSASILWMKVFPDVAGTSGDRTVSWSSPGALITACTSFLFHVTRCEEPQRGLRAKISSLAAYEELNDEITGREEALIDASSQLR
jgi:hypothetical protein